MRGRRDEGRLLGEAVDCLLIMSALWSFSRKSIESPVRSPSHFPIQIVRFRVETKSLRDTTTVEMEIRHGKKSTSSHAGLLGRGLPSLDQISGASQLHLEPVGHLLNSLS